MERGRMPGEAALTNGGRTDSVNRAELMTTFTLAGDEAGDASLNFGSLPPFLQAASGMEFYLFFVTELVSMIPVNIRQKGTLIMDEFGSANTALVKLKQKFKARNLCHEFSRIFVRRSRSEDLIQVADLIADAVLRRAAKQDNEAFEMIQEKVSAVFEYLN